MTRWSLAVYKISRQALIDSDGHFHIDSGEPVESAEGLPCPPVEYYSTKALAMAAIPSMEDRIALLGFNEGKLPISHPDCTYRFAAEVQEGHPKAYPEMDLEPSLEIDGRAVA